MSTDPNEPIQFDQVETPSASGTPVTACAACKSRLLETYWEANGHIVCPACREQIANRRPGGNALQAVAMSAGVAALGSLGWALLLKAGIVAGLLAVGIGWGIGWAMQKTTQGGTTRGLQLAAVLLTYLSVAGGYATYLMWEQGGGGSFVKYFVASLQFPRFAGSPLTLLIVAFGLWEAWRRTAPPVLNITGPYRISARPPAEGSNVG